jgi:ArsR family transcriptional regulator
MKRYADILKTLGHADRLRIIATLDRGELTVTELVQTLELSQPRITQYIKSLEAVDIVERLREGSWVFSRLKRSNTHVHELVQTVLRKLPVDDVDLIADSKRLEAVREARSQIADAFFAKVAQDDRQLGHEYLPQKNIEKALLGTVAKQEFDFMIDMGTGTGRMLELFAGQIRKGAGIDMNPDMLKVARHKLAGEEFGHISIQQSDLHATPFREGSADLVTLHQVLHYLDDPREAIGEAERLMGKDATLLIVDFETHDVEEFRENYAHRRLGFSETDMKDWFQDVGLNLQSIARFEHIESPTVIIWKAQK